jgi:hypothetical protein
MRGRWICARNLRGLNYRSRKIDFPDVSTHDGVHEQRAPDRGMSPEVLYLRVTAGPFRVLCRSPRSLIGVRIPRRYSVHFR